MVEMPTELLVALNHHAVKSCEFMARSLHPGAVPEMSAGRVSGLLVLGLLVSMMTALCLGAVQYTPLKVLSEALRAAGSPSSSSLDEAHTAILGEIRLPRVLLAALIGGALALTGALLQVVFQNPMADASLLGVGSGAALGAVVAVSSGGRSRFPALPAAAFVVLWARP